MHPGRPETLPRRDNNSGHCAKSYGIIPREARCTPNASRAEGGPTGWVGGGRGFPRISPLSTTSVAAVIVIAIFKKNRVIQEKKTDMNILHLPRHALADQDPTNTEETTETTDLPHITHKNTCKERKKMYTPPTQLAATPVDHRCGWRAAHLWNRHRESPATASRAEETMIFML